MKAYYMYASHQLTVLSAAAVDVLSFVLTFETTKCIFAVQGAFKAALFFAGVMRTADSCKMWHNG